MTFCLWTATAMTQEASYMYWLCWTGLGLLSRRLVGFWVTLIYRPSWSNQVKLIFGVHYSCICIYATTNYVKYFFICTRGPLNVVWPCLPYCYTPLVSPQTNRIYSLHCGHHQDYWETWASLSHLCWRLSNIWVLETISSQQGKPPLRVWSDTCRFQTTLIFSKN